MLKIKDLVVKYGGITAVKDISLEIKEGETVALIGANGAGKSSTLHAVSGLIRSASGTIAFDGKDITGVSPDKIVEMGHECNYFPTIENFNEIEKFLLQNCTKGDLLITMGAGDVVKIGDELLGR